MQVMYILSKTDYRPNLLTNGEKRELLKLIQGNLKNNIVNSRILVW